MKPSGLSFAFWMKSGFRTIAASAIETKAEATAIDSSKRMKGKIFQMESK